MTNLQKILQISFPVLALILGLGIYLENKQVERTQMKDLEEEFANVSEIILEKIASKTNDSKMSFTPTPNQSTVTRFEGPQIHLNTFTYNQKPYNLDSVRKAAIRKLFVHADLTSFEFDPDSAQKGMPDIKVTVSQPQLFQERKDQDLDLQNIFSSIGENPDKLSPIKTYDKVRYHWVDSSTLKYDYFQMELWLLEFTLTVETDGFHRNGLNDEIRKKRHPPFNLELKIPIENPWFINRNGSFSDKADMCIAGVFIKEISKIPSNASIKFIPDKISHALPLKGISKIESLHQVDKLIDNPSIWNKTDYVNLTITDIGTRGRLAVHKNEELTIHFLMPMLVRGNWDVKLDPKIFPKEMQAKVNKRGLSDILLPKFGLKLFGKGISTLLYILLIGIILVALRGKLLF